VTVVFDTRTLQPRLFVSEAAGLSITQYPLYGTRRHPTECISKGEPAEAGLQSAVEAWDGKLISSHRRCLAHSRRGVHTLNHLESPHTVPSDGG
jgi:hypothetical protein